MKNKKILRIALAAVVLIAVYCFLEASAPWQHPEDGESDEYVMAEVALLREFAAKYGEDALDAFKVDPFGWDMEKSGEVSREPVSWAVFKSRQAQMESRKENLAKEFAIRENVWNRLRSKN